MSTFRDYRNPRNPAKVDFRSADHGDATVIEVKPNGCPPSRYVAEPDGNRVRFRLVDADADCMQE